MGESCARFHSAQVVGLRTERVQCDEVWSFCYAKEKNLPAKMKGSEGVGSVWTWTALDADSKLPISWAVGSRDLETGRSFIRDTAARIINPRPTFITDGLHVYLSALVEQYTAEQYQYGTVSKIYGPSGNSSSPESRYSPGSIKGITKEQVIGAPALSDLSTSFVERFNLTMRMGNRRFTRLTNGFSKKFDNHCHMIALSIVHYNFCRVHRTLKKTPAMAAGITDHVWKIGDLLSLDMWFGRTAA